MIGFPPENVSSTRRSVMQLVPRAGSSFATVPPPMIDPDGEGAGLGRIGYDAIEAVHHGAGIGITEQRAIDVGSQSSVKPEIPPRRAQFVGGHGRRGKGTGGLGLGRSRTPLQVRRGSEFRSDTSLQIITRAMLSTGLRGGCADRGRG